MIRIVAIAVALFILAACCTSCMDSEPGEVTVRTSQAGQPLECVVMIYNDKGVQIQEDSTSSGFTRFGSLKPGTYYLKLKDHSQPTPNIYKAIRKFNIRTGDAKVIDVDVDDAGSNPADAPAGVTGGAAPAG